MIKFKSLEDSEIVEIHRRQNEECLNELSDLLDNKLAWAPMTLEQVKEKISDNLKKPHTSIFSIWAGDVFVGIGGWSSNWDTWSPWARILIWPEHRRKGYGTEAARMLMARSFLDNPGHAQDTGAPEWDEASISFIRSLGFREAGRMRRTGMLDGQYCDYLIFDILKKEYLALEQGASQ